MPTIILETHINASTKICFDLSRSIDLHTISTQQTYEKAIAGRTTGLIELNETVTWRAKHLGVWQTLTSKITEMDPPLYFVDEMVNGAFQYMRHEHHFIEVEGDTSMRDIFEFKSPMGFVGSLFNAVFLTGYLHNLLSRRNGVIKKYAESGEWKKIIAAK